MTPRPLGLEIIEADLLDDDYTGIEQNGNRGWELKLTSGRARGLSLLNYHPGDYQFVNNNLNVKRRTRILLR